MRKWGWILIGILLATLALAQIFLMGLRYERLVYNRMVDGDTFWVTNLRDGSEWRVRLWGVNAPDTKSCYFDEATKILEKELTTKKVEYDRQGYDGYGRILAKVYVDGVNVEEILVATGAASVYDAFEVHDQLKPSKVYVDGLKILEEKAKKENFGMWSEMCM
ncbi:MAG TPA: thermonuclease family protein [Spirochaetia bacterium]|nr:thermonuclease family protein [Spirochaetia bacterium]